MTNKDPRDIIIRPVVSEKSYAAYDNNVYTFVVAPNANKIEIRSAVEQTDWHDQAEQTFLKHLLQRLDAAITTGKTKSLIVVAPPRALGMIRPAYSAALKKALRAEIDKDFVKMPVHEIEKHLTGN